MSFRTIFNVRTKPVAIFCRDHIVAVAFRNIEGILECRTMEIPQGILVKGVIKEQFRFNEVLSALLVDAPIKKGAEATFVVQESLVFTYLFSRNGGADLSQIRDEIGQEAREIIPIPYESLATALTIIPKTRDGNIQAILIATPKEIIAQYVNSAKQLGISVVAIESEMTCLGRVLLPDNVSVTAIIDIGANSTSLSVFDDDSVIPKFSLLIPIAGNAFTDSLMTHAGVDREEAERLKRIEGFDIHAGEGRTLVILQERAQAILAHLEKAFSHYEIGSKRKIERIILAGGSANIPSLDKYFSINLKREVFIGNPLPRVREVVSIPEGTPVIQVAAVLGSLIGTLNLKKNKPSLNLLTDESETRTTNHYIKTPGLFNILGLIVFLISLLIAGYIFYQMIYLPNIKNDEVLRNKTPSTVPFFVEVTDEDSVVTTSTLEVATTSNTDIYEVYVATTSDTGVQEAKLSTKIVILDTPTGWLNAREGPDISYAILTRVNPGDVFPLIDVRSGWVKLLLSDGRAAWVHHDYIATSTDPVAL